MIVLKTSLVSKKKTRLKIEGDVEKRIELFANSEGLQKLIKEKVISLNLSEKSEKNVVSGILLTDNESISLIRINLDWYTFKVDMNLFELLCTFVDPFLAKQLIFKTKKAIIRVKNAKIYADTEKFNTPIRLVQIS